LLTAAVIPPGSIVVIVSAISLVLLAALGGMAAAVGGASVARGALRVTFWGALAMGITAGIGRLVGAVI
jgi:VIT1/CCC1 family predicted Fe2+/Mn2+ transporter